VSLDRAGILFRVIDFCSRALGKLFFGDRRRLSTHLGNELISQNAAWHHLIAAGLIYLITFEQGHCFKNAGKL
jgi:hypothetical protein